MIWFADVMIAAVDSEGHISLCGKHNVNLALSCDSKLFTGHFANLFFHQMQLAHHGGYSFLTPSAPQELIKLHFVSKNP